MFHYNSRHSISCSSFYHPIIICFISSIKVFCIIYSIIPICISTYSFF